ncbi:MULTISPECIES: hypothetical protein [Dactylosporangium]|uniref:Uncharacterized protein n=1 Tax=Dactylosporangium vinaceum TaxID=53362 RepID=A0ABV5MBC6_9ACTN|nr:MULTISPECIES: hypothetical protein [Dactylosporangium]UAB98384.1 hypothetical protein Dvina_09985 [Dactylosporangium vinaceum]UWZ46634.1 hypothetical protein Dmats_09525 [Dactylosporangium matsuzakiense]
MRTREVPDHIFEKLIGALVGESAIALLTQRARGATLHAGEAFGRVLAWLWETADDVVPYVADLIAQVRYHAPGACPEMSLDDVLGAVGRAAAPMPPAEAAAMLATLRAGLPAYL